MLSGARCSREQTRRLSRQVPVRRQSDSQLLVLAVQRSDEHRAVRPGADAHRPHPGREDMSIGAVIPAPPFVEAGAEEVGPGNNGAIRGRVDLQ